THTVDRDDWRDWRFGRGGCRAVSSRRGKARSEEADRWLHCRAHRTAWAAHGARGGNHFRGQGRRGGQDSRDGESWYQGLSPPCPPRKNPRRGVEGLIQEWWLHRYTFEIVSGYTHLKP